MPATNRHIRTERHVIYKVNRRMVIFTLGQIELLEAVLLLLPALTALIYKEKCLWAILITAGVCGVLGGLFMLVGRPKNRVIYAKEGFVIVALAWIVMSALGAVPFVLSGEIPNYIDAFFETVSGFTTTGASILTNVEAMSHGLLFWRSFTHWIGGMGVLVFIMAIVPNVSERSIHIIRAEMPGPIVGKLVPRIKDTAKILYLIYICMTAVEIILLVAGKMPLFDSLIHTFGTAGTGGFGMKADSIASYSPYIQWVITVFMLLFGVNFNLYYLMLIRRFRAAFKSTELWTYLGIVAASIGLIAVNIYKIYGTAAETVRQSAFQVVSVITTTGYATSDFNMWPGFSKSILLVLMFIGACASSTGGGLKVSRLIIIIKMGRNELRHLLHPKSVTTVRFEGKQLDAATLHNTGNFFILYVLTMFIIFLAVSFDKFDMETNISAVASCFNNVGPAFGAAGPASSYAGFSSVSKIVLSLAMLFGRLELFPMLLLFAPSTWSRK